MVFLGQLEPTFKQRIIYITQLPNNKKEVFEATRNETGEGTQKSGSGIEARQAHIGRGRRSARGVFEEGAYSNHGPWSIRSRSNVYHKGDDNQMITYAFYKPAIRNERQQRTGIHTGLRPRDVVDFAVFALVDLAAAAFLGAVVPVTAWRGTNQITDFKSDGIQRYQPFWLRRVWKEKWSSSSVQRLALLLSS
jgi:hypothetical protein